METVMRAFTCCVSSNWRGISSMGVLLPSMLVFTTLGITLADTSTTAVSLPISQDSSNVRTIKDNVPATLVSVPYSESSLGETYTSSSLTATSSPASLSVSSTVSSDVSSTSTDSTSTLFETLVQNSSNKTLQTSSEAPSNISQNYTTSLTNSTVSSPGEESAKTVFTPTSSSSSPISFKSSNTKIVAETTNNYSSEVTSTEGSSSSDDPVRFVPQAATTDEVPLAFIMADELDRKTVVGASTSNNSSSELPKIHFTLFTDWWHATILLGVEVFFYIITLGIIYFMRRNNIRWPQVMQDDSDSQSDTEPFG